MHEAQKIAEDVAYRIVYHTRDFFTIRSVTLSFSVAGVQKKKKKNREMKRNKDFRYDIHFFLSITFTNNTIKKKKEKKKKTIINVRETYFLTDVVVLKRINR